MSFEYNGRKIITNFDMKPCHSRSCDWDAVYEDYDGAPDSNCPIGRGATEEEAVFNLIENTEDTHA